MSKPKPAAVFVLCLLLVDLILTVLFLSVCTFCIQWADLRELTSFPPKHPFNTTRIVKTVDEAGVVSNQTIPDFNSFSFQTKSGSVYVRVVFRGDVTATN